MSELISIADATARGIRQLRQNNWHHPMDHFVIDITGGLHGPWAHYFSPFNMVFNDCDPVDTLLFPGASEEKLYVPYVGPPPASVEYQAEVVRVTESLQSCGTEG